MMFSVYCKIIARTILTPFSTANKFYLGRLLRVLTGGVVIHDSFNFAKFSEVCAIVLANMKFFATNHEKISVYTRSYVHQHHDRFSF